MWKEDKGMDFYSKRDDDSAIGDSANNSAEEETTHSRRKSPVTDSNTDLPSEAYAQLRSKLNTKIPDCLLKDSEESLENCKKFSRSSQDIRSSPKRVIRVLPATAVLTENQMENTKKERTSQPNMSVLKAKLQYLFFEMKKLRELDHDILRTFSNLNENIEEMRLKIDENETTLEQNLADDMVDDEVTMTLSDSRLNEWDELDFAQTRVEKDEKFVVPVTKVPTSYASLANAKSSKICENSSPFSSSVTSSSDSTLLKEICEIVNSNLTQPEKSEEPKRVLVQPVPYANVAYDHLDVTSTTHSERRRNKHNGHSSASAIEMEKLCSKGYYRFKSPHPSPTPTRVAPVAEVWVKKETTKQMETTTSSNEINRTQRPKSGTIPTKKHIDRTKQQQKSSKHSNTFGRMTSNESYHVSRRSEWLAPDFKQKKQVSDFQTQKEYQNLVGLSKVSGNSVPPIRQNSVQKLPNSVGFEHSSSSVTSSYKAPPVQNSVSHTSNKWGRFGLKRNSKSIDIHNSNNNSGVFVNKNFKPNGVASPHSSNVIAVSYKQRTSDTIYNLVQSQDDVTFL